MPVHALGQKTARDKVTEAERLVRDFADHLDRGFAPKIRDLLQLVEHGADDRDGRSISDRSIRNSVQLLLQADDYTRQLYEQLSAYLTAIQADLHEIVEGE